MGFYLCSASVYQGFGQQLGYGDLIVGLRQFFSIALDAMKDATLFKSARKRLKKYHLIL